MATQTPLSGRVAVITGASSGIGAATASRLARDGVQIALLARRSDRLEALRDEIVVAGGHALAIKADIMNLNTLERAAHRICAEFGRIDMLVHSAGILTMSLAAERDPLEWRRLAERNLLGTFYATHAFLPFLLKSQGEIITISSINGRNANEAVAAYNATRFGLVGWSDALRKELAERGIRVIVIKPGSTRSEMHIPPKENGSRSIEFVQSPRHGPLDQIDYLQPENIAQIIQYAVSQPRNISLGEFVAHPGMPN